MRPVVLALALALSWLIPRSEAAAPHPESILQHVSPPLNVRVMYRGGVAELPEAELSAILSALRAHFALARRTLPAGKNFFDGTPTGRHVTASGLTIYLTDSNTFFHGDDPGRMAPGAHFSIFRRGRFARDIVWTLRLDRIFYGHFVRRYERKDAWERAQAAVQSLAAQTYALLAPEFHYDDPKSEILDNLVAGDVLVPSLRALLANPAILRPGPGPIAFFQKFLAGVEKTQTRLRYEIEHWEEFRGPLNIPFSTEFGRSTRRWDAATRRDVTRTLDRAFAIVRQFTPTDLNHPFKHPIENLYIAHRRGRLIVETTRDPALAAMVAGLPIGREAKLRLAHVSHAMFDRWASAIELETYLNGDTVFVDPESGRLRDSRLALATLAVAGEFFGFWPRYFAKSIDRYGPRDFQTDWGQSVVAILDARIWVARRVLAHVDALGLTAAEETGFRQLLAEDELRLRDCRQHLGGADALDS